jgi:hypothetical protein
MLLEAEQNPSVKDGRDLQTNQPLDDDESSISERERRLNQAIEQNISIDNNLYNEFTLSKDVSEPLAVIRFVCFIAPLTCDVLKLRRLNSVQLQTFVCVVEIQRLFAWRK